MKKALDKAVETQKRCLDLVWARRKKWPTASKTIEQCLDNFAQEWKGKTEEEFYVERRTNKSSPHGIYTFNSNCVSIHRGNSYTGIGKKDENSSSLVIEKSGHLLFTQFPDGRIMTIATPATSELKDLPFKQIMVFPPMSPQSMTYEKVERALEVYLWLQRVTISVALPNFWDRMKLFRYWIRGWRHSNDWKAWILFWVAVATFVFAAISTIASIKTIAQSEQGGGINSVTLRSTP